MDKVNFSALYSVSNGWWIDLAFGLICFSVLVMACYIFITRDRSAYQDLKKKVGMWAADNSTLLNAHSFTSERLCDRINVLEKSREMYFDRCSALEKKVEWLDMKLSAKEQNFNVRLSPLVVKGLRKAPNGLPPPRKVMKKIKNRLDKFDN